jgi:hypothetical protein
MLLERASSNGSQSVGAARDEELARGEEGDGDRDVDEVHTSSSCATWSRRAGATT